MLLLCSLCSHPPRGHSLAITSQSRPRPSSTGGSQQATCWCLKAETTASTTRAASPSPHPLSLACAITGHPTSANNGAGTREGAHPRRALPDNPQQAASCDSQTLQPQLPPTKLKAGHQQTALWPGPMRGAQSGGRAPAELPSGDGSTPPWGLLGDTGLLRGRLGSSEGHGAPRREMGLLRGTPGSSEGQQAPQRDTGYTGLFRETPGSSEGHGGHRRPPLRPDEAGPS